MATPTAAHNLTPEEWKKSVCALFTNVLIYDSGHPHLQVEGIKKILKVNGDITPKGDKDYHYYNPRLTALYEMNDKGEIVRVFFNDMEEPKKHAEKKFLESLKEDEKKCRRSVHSIGLNYSPCTIPDHKCAEMIVKEYKDTEDKPEIHLSREYKNVQQTNDKEGIKLLMMQGFELKVLDTDPIFRYLLDRAPNDVLKGQLHRAYIGPRSQRDEGTRAFLAKCFDECEVSKATATTLPSVNDLIHSTTNLSLSDEKAKVLTK